MGDTRNTTADGVGKKNEVVAMDRVDGAAKKPTGHGQRW